MNKKWEVCNPDKNRIREVQEKYKLGNLLSTVIVNRDIDINEDMDIFLNPRRSDFHDPFLLPDMEKAVDRIERAINEKEKIMIYGDYDVDGITSITVLKSYLEERGMEIDSYIPNRLSEGYGLNKDIIKAID